MTNPTPATSGAELIAAERARQVSAEGWTDAHDEEHDRGEMVKAAVVYAMPNLSVYWPWDRQYLKPSGDRIHDLVKAGALIAAEIDRLLRAATNTEAP